MFMENKIIITGTKRLEIFKNITSKKSGNKFLIRPVNM